jgi:hypothetical protein
LKPFSFIYHPIEKLHGIIPDIMPGIKKIITVHFDNSKNRIFGILTENGNGNYATRELNIDTALPSLQRYMEEKSPFSWLSLQSLPFDIEKKTDKLTIDIFSELQNIVLLIRVPDEMNQLNDLVFLYLNENPSNFGVTNTVNPLTTDNKSIIAFLLYNTIKTLIQGQNEDREVLKFANMRTRQVINNTETLKQELERTRDNYGLSLVKLCQNYIRDWSARNRKKYILTPAALEKIKKYKGDLKNLDCIIAETISYVDNLYFGVQGEIEISEWHIHFDPVTTGSTDIRNKMAKEDKYAKTIALLDKLEKAALQVKSKHLKLTGTNVGAACPTPISAPAISDALYNHRGKINSLIITYPENWETIKSEFRPVMNILKEDIS